MLAFNKASLTIVAVAFLVSSAGDSHADDEELTRLLKTFREEFVAVKPGDGMFPAEFVMGDDMGQAEERPAHRVAVKRPFSIARYEVPQNLWQAVMGENPSRWKGKRNSVEMISYGDAIDFCRRATEAMRRAKLITDDEVIRLPSEAEWEYAARAGTTARYSFGDDAAKLGDYGWFHGNAAGNDPPVGAKKSNDWQLYDVHGYLWEWCADRWHESYRDAPTDGSAWNEGGDPRRVLRGGSWKDDAEKLTSTFRRPAEATFRDDAVGLRAVLSRVAEPLIPSAGDDDVHKELKELQGKWKTVALEAGGMPLPKESVPDFLFIVGADGKSTGQMGKDEYQAKISVDPTKKPKTIDNVHETGQHKGKKQFGIYKVEGGKWIVCMTAPGAAESDRPKTFDTKDTRNVVFIFERVQEDKQP